jgi:hypothetical protein
MPLFTPLLYHPIPLGLPTVGFADDLMGIGLERHLVSSSYSTHILTIPLILARVNSSKNCVYLRQTLSKLRSIIHPQSNRNLSV